MMFSVFGEVYRWKVAKTSPKIGKPHRISKIQFPDPVILTQTSPDLKIIFKFSPQNAFLRGFWKKQKNAGKRSEWKRDHFDKPHQVNLTDDLIILKIETQRPSTVETSPRWGFPRVFPQNLTARDPLRLKITRTDNSFMSSPRHKHHFGAIFGKPHRKHAKLGP